MMTSMRIILYQIFFRPTNINETFAIELTSDTSTNNNESVNSKMSSVSKSIFQLKYLIDQAQNLLHNFQNNMYVALNPETTGFNLNVAKYFENQGSSQNHS